MKQNINIANLNCANCANAIEKHFKKLNITCKINIAAKKVTFISKQDKSFSFYKNELQTIGFIALDNDKEVDNSKRKEKIILIITTILALPFIWMIIGHFYHPLVPFWLHNGLTQITFAAPIQFIIGWRFYQSSYYQIKKRTLGMDVLVALGTSIAFSYSLYLYFFTTTTKYYFETASLIIWMVIIGEYLEFISKQRSNTTLKELLMLTPKITTKIIADHEIKINIKELIIGDIIKVLPNQVIPIDSTLISANAYIDTANITGEAKPITYKQGTLIYGGTLNLGDTIYLKVTKTGDETLLSKIVNAVEEANLIKPKYQRLADKIAKYFVSIIISLALITFLLYFFITYNPDKAFETSIAVLVISCPCALGLATPTSIACASSVAYKNKILYRNANFFELSSKVDAIAFDKTGTLTKEQLLVETIIGDENTYPYLFNLEKTSLHPIAKAITSYLKEYPLMKVKNFQIIAGQGIKGNVNDHQLIISKLEQTKLPAEIANIVSQYPTHLILQVIMDNRLTNLIILKNTLKPEAKQLITFLRKNKITPYILSGDNENHTKQMAHLLNDIAYYANLLPHEKSQILLKLKQRHKMVAFVGDGVNDAPALKHADIAISVANASDIATEASDIVLLKDDLLLVLLALDLSRKTRHNIMQNLWWAFGYNLLTIPLAIANIIPPIIAGSLHIFSSLLVVFNALRLKLYRFKLLNKKHIKCATLNNLTTYNTIKTILQKHNISAEISISKHIIKGDASDARRIKKLLKEQNLLK